MPNSPFDQERVAAPRDPEVEQAEENIARTREQVSRSVTALRHAVAETTDWRGWVRRRPGLYLVAAFAVGFVWGSRASRTK